MNIMEYEKTGEQDRKQATSQEASRIRELVTILREAGRAYYQESREIMSNFDYDRL